MIKPTVPGSDNEKRGQSPLRKGRGLILVRSSHLRGMVRDVLAAVGIVDHEFMPDDDALIMSLRYGSPASFVLCEASAPSSAALKIARFIRWDPACPRIALPLIIFGEEWTVHSLTEARDAGVSEMIALPITMHAFIRRLISAICQERPLIMSESYRGPDRRKRRDSAHAGFFRREEDQIKNKAKQERAATSQDALLHMLKRGSK